MYVDPWKPLRCIGLDNLKISKQYCFGIVNKWIGVFLDFLFPRFTVTLSYPHLTLYIPTAMVSHPPIAIAELADHIERLKANEGVRFSQEYESIEPGQQFTWDNSNMEVNKPKNRYANVIAYDHSRIILQSVEGVPGSDYINSNYMDGYRKHNAYIATQVGVEVVQFAGVAICFCLIHDMT